MDTESDNFYAEMLLKVLGARERHDGSSAAGAAVVRSELASRGIPLAGVVIADGSGLSQLDRLTVRALAALLVSARSDAGVSAALRGSLAVAGETGTLEDRMRTGPAHGIVRGKTGTTNRSSALSGYVDDTYAFAILINGAPVAASAARAAEDRYVQLLAAA
jgi:PBP4 family serine-type D-alanyl-D-alanine carboxypeptidase